MTPNHFDDDNYWANVEPFMFGDDRWAQAQQDARDVLNLTSVCPPAKILDLACGPGRHTHAFARLGHSVRAVDRSPHFIERANARTPMVLNQSIEYVLSDICSLPRQNGPRLAVMLFNSFGYSSSKDNSKLMKHIRDIIDDDCCFLISVAGKELIARDFRNLTSKMIDGRELKRRSEISAGWTHLTQHWTITEAGAESKQHTTVQELYSGIELSDLLRRSGFSTVQLFGDLKGRPYDNGATELVALARNDGP